MATRKTSTIPKAPVGRILMKAGAKRVSQSAMDTFSDIIHQMAVEIAEKSVMIAKHAGRKTVHEDDIKLAAR
ncbi:histone [Candidatus Woesearchaeota archaeon]|nr:histone [Candidatus Woesearchaeota archaeon]